MDQPLNEKLPGKPRILVAPLDWGLGHATRSIPIIRELLAQGCEVLLAGEGAQKKLLQQEFPNLPFLPLDGYRVKYARSATGLLLSIFRQTHKIFTAIKKENAWLKKQVKEHGFDAVISDNRYGLYHSTIPCVFITHQLIIKSPLGKWTENFLQKINYRYINRFTECWVPDLPCLPDRQAAGQAGEENKNNLAGELSHPRELPAVPVRYVGILSRFVRKDSFGEIRTVQEKKNHLLVVLSGPEPQRSILENKIIKELSHYNGTATIVRGLPNAESIIPSGNMIRFYNHLLADDLNKEMQQAEFVISRCGYSTIMDLVKLQKKSILIPTPGQTEQEYLADYLSQKKIVFCVIQKNFSLTEALQKARQFSYYIPADDSEHLLWQIISKFISSLTKD